MHPLSRTWSHPRRRFVALLLTVLFLYLLVTQAVPFQHSLSSIRYANFTDIWFAIITVLLTFPLAAATYHLLSRRQLIFRRTVLVAIANMFTNRLLPAGTGSIATFFVYLRKRKHTFSQATSVVAVNNLLGFLSHTALLLVLSIFAKKSFHGFTIPHLSDQVIAVAVVAVTGICITVLLIPKWRQSIQLVTMNLKHDLKYYRHKQVRLAAAFITSMLLTITNAICLWFCVQAVGGRLGLVAALAVFTVGLIVGTVTPTPGGLGGTEAGLFAALISYHVTSPAAVTAVILYRLISYWLTLGCGVIAYVYVERRGYLHRFEPLT